MKYKVLLIAALVILLFATVLQAVIVDSTGELFWFSWSTLVSFSKEVAFACLIAWIIINSVEAASRKRQDDMASRFLEKQEESSSEFLDKQDERAQELSKSLAEDVYKAVFAQNVPRELVDAVVDQVLGTEIVRMHHVARFELNEFPDGDSEAKKNHLLLTTTTEYTIVNVSNREVKVPIRVGYPTPGPKALKRYSKLKSISIDGEELSSNQIKKGDIAMPDEVDKVRFKWDRDLGAGEELKVVTVSDLVKDRSDNEIWVSLFPSMGMDLSVLVNVEGLQFGARACSRSKLKNQMGQLKTGQLNRFKLDGPVLPHQSIIVWWRPE